jgi:hypothetical protein
MTADGEPRGGRLSDLSIVVSLVIGAAMVAASAIIHLYLWGKEDGYRHVPTVGPMFLAQGIAGCLLAVAVLVQRRLILALAGAAYMAASLAALYKSIHGGLFDFDETFDAPWVKTSVVVEVVGLAAFGVATALLAATGGRTRTRTVDPVGVNDVL